MGIIVALTFAALVLLCAASAALSSSDRHDRRERLTVRDIQTRVAAEPPRTYVPMSRGW